MSLGNDITVDLESVGVGLMESAGVGLMVPVGAPLPYFKGVPTESRSTPISLPFVFYCRLCAVSAESARFFCTLSL